MKKFLRPKKLRRGSPTAIFVAKEDNGYWLGVYHELREIPTGLSRTYSGEGREYKAVQRIRISKDLYQALMKEARSNEKIMATVNRNEKA